MVNENRPIFQSLKGMFGQPKVEDVLPKEPESELLKPDVEERVKELGKEKKVFKLEDKEKRLQKELKELRFKKERPQLFAARERAKRLGLTLQKQLKKTQPRPRTVSIPLKDVMGISGKPKGQVNPLQPNIESLIFPTGRSPPLSHEPTNKGGNILKQKSIFWK